MERVTMCQGVAGSLLPSTCMRTARDISSTSRVYPHKMIGTGVFSQEPASRHHTKMLRFLVTSIKKLNITPDSYDTGNPPPIITTYFPIRLNVIFPLLGLSCGSLPRDFPHPKFFMHSSSPLPQIFFLSFYFAD